MGKGGYITRCASRAPSTPLGESARAECPRDSLCRDAHLVVSAAVDEVLKAPIYRGYGQQPTKMSLRRFMFECSGRRNKNPKRREEAVPTEEGEASVYVCIVQRATTTAFNIRTTFP
ncbi:hypothetical protein EVAR_48068_1 [Eumeta japonica]|uniref:Uncharacterized protein n=1 Tax=Eumeta variegata TaxID=151549 RepID=A0A4C1X882_EUMVA|nr:hypothetical protein EVAR_48068_1 [Eumeta japonica]